MPDVILGIDFGGTKTALALATPNGDVLRREQLPSHVAGGATATVQSAVDAGRSMVSEAEGELMGVGVSSMGITLEEGVLIAPNVPGWHELRLPGVLRAAFPGSPIRIENDVKAAAYAELRFGMLRDVGTGIYLNLGTGIAAALIVGGRIVRGAHGAAGEIGFNPRSPAETDGAQAGRVPLEEYVGGRSVERIVADGTDLTPADGFARYGEDPALRRRLDPVFAEIAYHLTNLAIAIDPSRIVVGGGLMRSGEVVLPAIEQRVRRFLPFQPEIVAARFGADAALMGALALAQEPMPAI